ncbi:hypothetical protein [Massilia sp. ZL223]|uniref:hypothetical protein n=1 Tax=Massilia sp. ZL223 TaxID=2824904 RepID=UPI001B816D6B|nr:hypothetical protein [Massilia sp. ZL223]MBQ5963517.1 hypothetical protein [Massilia sp. ZL223]
MSEAYQLVTLNHATPGMVLSHELLDLNGLVLLAKGAVLSEAIIASLARHGIDTVPVTCAEGAEAPDPAAVQARLDHVFRNNDRDNHDDWATGLLRRYVEDYRLQRGVAP